MRLIDETGNRYGKLTVIERADSSRPGAHWLCRCDCGKEIVVGGCRLRSGNTKSCGCSRRRAPKSVALKSSVKKRGGGGARKLPKGIAARNCMYAGYKRGAKKRGLVFDLSMDEFAPLTKGNCYYCGCEPTQLYIGNGRHNGAYVYNGVDRVDNNKGYTIDNVVSCCKTCNAAKRGMSVDEFLAWVIKIYQKQNPD